MAGDFKGTLERYHRRLNELSVVQSEIRHSLANVMDALRGINKDLGITVLCNLHALDVARSYCDRLVGMSAGRVVFDGAPDALTEDLVHTLYGIEAAEVDASAAPHSSAVGVVVPFVRHA